MTNTVVASGTQTATISTEHVLNAPSSAVTYVLIVDTAAMVAGDTLELRAYSTVLTSGTSHQCYSASYANAQADPIKVSIPLPGTGFGNSFTLKQTAGTGRDFPWSLLSL
jgi:hypothetical protein